MLSTHTSIARLKETLERLREERTTADSEWQAMVDTVPAAILYLKPDRTISRANRLAKGLIADKSRLDQLSHLEPWRTASSLCDLVLATGADDFMEVEDGASNFWEIAASTLESESDGSLVLVLRDITERVRLANKLQRRERLSDIGTLFHGISHRVRSGLFGVTGLIDVLLGQTTDAEHVSYLEMQRHQIDLIVDLLERVNQFAGSTEPNRTRGDLEPLINAALVEAEARAAVDDIDTDVEIEPSVPPLMIDRDQLTLALSAVLENAYEFSPQGGRVSVYAQSVRKGGDRWLCLEVGDQGPGITAQPKERIFEPFFSGRSNHGLGLSIAQRIVEDHGGRIEVSNRSPTGCLVTILLPIDVRAGSAREDRTP